MEFFSTALGIIGALLLLTLLVVIHEAGHFSAGRRLGFRIEEFAVGFGPKALKWVKKGILYTVRWLPFGGFVRFFGDNEEAENPSSPDNFNNKPIYKRLIVFAAGPLTNIVFGFILTVVVLVAFGDYAPFIGTTLPGSPAEKAGILADDRIVEVDGQRIDFYTELQIGNVFRGKTGDVSAVTVERGGERLTFDVPYEFNKEYNRDMIGITYRHGRMNYDVFSAIGLSFKWLYINIVAILDTIVGVFFLGRGAADMAGFVGTIAIISEVIRSNAENALRLAAIISMNLGVVNLLPLPALDGGKIVLLGVEKVRRRQLPVKVEMFINLLGFAFLIVCMLLLTIQDISRLVG